MSNRQQVLNNSLSLDMSINDEDTPLLSLIEDRSIQKPEESVLENTFLNHIKTLLYNLPIKEACVFELKLNGFKIDDNLNELENSLEGKTVYISDGKYTLEDIAKVISNGSHPINPQSRFLSAASTKCSP